MPMIGARFYTQLDAAQMRNDVIEEDLAKVNHVVTPAERLVVSVPGYIFSTNFCWVFFPSVS